MKNLLIIVILAVLLVFSGCSSVRTGSKQSKSQQSSKVASNKPASVRSSKDDQTKQSAKSRFSDTTTIIIEPSPQSSKNNLVNQFALASVDFDKELYSSACPEFRHLSETFAKTDSLRCESLFYLSECLILENKLNPAQSILNDLYKSNIPDAIMEKVIVRLGQLHCVSGKKQQAKEMFDLLARRYPKSIYLPLANCDVVK